ncbi:hypothetical protein PAXRUDRAFT_830938 [Paxillus rubicundulus Ve08.2h10]|uniref:Uncharacterized protein n=1 Tax=Paxillus rubicundulus Ve08.2h10 TaxID=930991 RepID=A0A0D0D495_9AGAM|nr:hypothetical protein PAXRUDRAFT_830938 [Paxillus rubicundulus Ve08.2h10]
MALHARWKAWRPRSREVSLISVRCPWSLPPPNKSPPRPVAVVSYTDFTSPRKTLHSRKPRTREGERE